jgi:branched-chain amino acid transport system ATP-binding protein
MTSVLDLRNVDAGYNGVRVVRGLSLEVQAGEIVALLGPNGAGKTTTLLTVSGLLRPLAGDVLVLGEALGRRSPQQVARAGVAHVPEGRCLFPSLTVRENVLLASRGKPAAAADALDLFPELVPHLGRKAGLLSGGQQQMLALARGLASRPSLLLVDEMSLGLAPIIVEQLLPVLRDVAATGCGVLLVEQHVHMALAVADRAYVLANGELQLSGGARQLSEDRDALASRYLGGVR